MKKYLLLTLSALLSIHTATWAQNLVQSFIESNVKGNTNFGMSVSRAGDVNNDGYDDVIVGASGYYSSTGRAYIYYGGNAMDNTADVTLTGEDKQNYFGTSVSTAGDVNNDGYDDVIVGASGYLENTGQALIYYGGSNMDNTADMTLIGNDIEYYFGCSVSSAGDVNNDGYDDVIVGANGYSTYFDGNSDYTGRAYIYYGGSTMNSTFDVILTGEAPSSWFGHSVSTAGDVNNDGYTDVIVGAYGYSNYTGKAFIYYGGSAMNNTADITLTGEAIDSYFGYSVSTAGDVNNDGYTDAIVGAFNYSHMGRAYIYYGGSNMDNASDVTLTPEVSVNNFGRSVSTAGDVNKDGYADIVVGATGYSSYTGRAYIYYGGNPMDPTADVILAGETTGNQFGYTVSTAGDINKDGYTDVIVGAYGYNTQTGRSYIYYGGSNMNNSADVTLNGETTGNQFGYTVSTAGDLNKDGYDDIIVGAALYAHTTGRAYIYYGGSNMDNTADVTLVAEATNIYFGSSVSSAGDINKDGYDDVIVGASGYSTNTGRAYIYYGGIPMDATVDVTLTGEANYHNFGCAVSTAGDVNNDGAADVIVGAHGYPDYGGAFIYYGGNPMNNVADLILTGEASIENIFGCSVSTIGDVNNDEFDDVIVGDSRYSNSTGRAYIYYGGNPMNNTADVTLTGEDFYNEFGNAVSAAGDVNKDGYADVIVGAPSYSSGTGRAYIYYGGSPMNNTADITLISEVLSSNFGCSVSTAGDINKDGYADVIAGASRYAANTGRVYIYYGGSTMDNIADKTFTGEVIDSYFGHSVSNAGDINGNGFDDFIVGAYIYPANGKTYIYGNACPQTITFDAISTKTYGDGTFIVSAIGGSSGNPIVFTSSDPTIATCTGTNGSNVTLLKAGTCQIYANQAGNTGYYEAPQVSQTLTISKKAISVTGITANNKVYDGTTAATLSGGTLSGVKPGDGIIVSGGTGTFADKNIGSSKTITATAVTISGPSAGNYTVTLPIGLTANITAKALTLKGEAASKVYDGTTTATFSNSSLSGLIPGDAVTLTYGTANFIDANIGTGKTIIASGFAISGSSVGNYTFTQPTNLTGNITAKTITITGITASNKVYDGTTTASISGGDLSDVVPGEDVTFSTGTATFADKNVGTGKTIVASGFTISGTSAGNYTLTQPADITADITTKALTITGVTASNKVYDGTTAASLSGGTLSGVISGDDVTLTSGTGIFADANAGTGKTVNLAGFSLNGADAQNYTLTQPASVVADIEKATPVINWENPADIAAGIALSNVQLNASCNIGGSFVYNPAVSTVLSVGNNQALAASFTPADATNYATASKTVYINVTPATSATSIDQPQVTLFPNPCSETLNISGLQSFAEGLAVTIQIFDNHGKLLTSQERIVVTDIETMDLNALPSGNYTVVIQTKKAKKTLGLMKL